MSMLLFRRNKRISKQKPYTVREAQLDKAAGKIVIVIILLVSVGSWPAMLFWHLCYKF